MPEEKNKGGRPAKSSADWCTFPGNVHKADRMQLLVSLFNGPAGFGLYWMLISTLLNESYNMIKLSENYIRRTCALWRTTQEDFNKMIEFCKYEELLYQFEDSEYWFSPILDKDISGLTSRRTINLYEGRKKRVKNDD